MGDLAALVLRAGLGIMFTAHGLQMAFGKFNGPGVAGFSEMLSKLGFSSPLIWAYAAAYIVLTGGLCLVAGFLTRIASALLVVFMCVAIVKVHLANGFFITGGGYEYNFVIICGLVALMFNGPGRFSLWQSS